MVCGVSSMGDSWLGWFADFWRPDDDQDTTENEVSDYNNAAQDAEDIANKSPTTDKTDSTEKHTWFWGSTDKENGDS